MAQTTVAQFAAELGLPTTLLLDQLKGAGVNKAALDDKLEEADKSALLDYLRKGHGAESAPKNKITLTRKSNSEIKKTDSSGRARTIQVEVRKKRVLERPEDVIAEQEQTATKELMVTNETVVEVEADDSFLVEAIEVETEQAVELVEALVEETPAVEETIVEEQIEPLVAPATEVAEVIEAKSTTIKKQVLSSEQIAIREHEAKRHATLAAMQAEDVRKKQELIQRRLDDEAKKLADAEAAKVKAVKLSEGTLHKPESRQPIASQRKRRRDPGNKEVSRGERGIVR